MIHEMVPKHEEHEICVKMNFLLLDVSLGFVKDRRQERTIIIVAMIEILHILLHKQLNWMPFHRLHAGVKSPCFLRMLIARRTLGHSWSPLNC